MKVLVIGLGATGDAVVRRLLNEGAHVLVADDAPRTTPDGVEMLDPGSDLPAVDLVVPSPGVPPRHPLLDAALRAGIPVRPEIELAAERMAAKLVAITGTNGKSTVTTLIAEMLGASGITALAAGNLGTPLLDVVDSGAAVLVAEVSSFQLAFTTTFAPDVSVLLNLAEDHLDWHGGFAAYSAAKTKVFAAQRRDAVLVAGLDDPVIAALVRDAPGRVVGFGRDPHGFHVDNGWLVDNAGERLVAATDLPEHLDPMNALAAAAAALAAGASRGGIAEAAREFAGLPHRGSLVGEAGGVRFVDDSKATNPHAALRAIDRYPSVVLIAGGRNKALDLGVLRSRVDRVRAVVAIGEAADEVDAAFAGARRVVRANSMDRAVALAIDLAESGDTVLLAPACTSLDQFADYGARGDAFVAAVAARIGQAS